MAAFERLVNLALALASAREPRTATALRDSGIYPPGQDDAAFQRMFERDKDELRSMGFVIDVDEQGAYRLDPRATFASTIDLTAPETAVLGAVGSALLDDPAFPFAADLRMALAKLVAGAGCRAAAAGTPIPGADARRQGETVAAVSRAVDARKRIGFEYTNSLGVSGPRTVEPYGLFLHEGRWYAVGRDVEKDEVRTFAAARMERVEPNAQRPKSPDFSPPEGFDVAAFARLPFQYGPLEDEFVAKIDVDASESWRLTALSSGRGQLTSAADGGVTWAVTARSETLLARFVLENGPGLTVSAPARVAERVRAGLRDTEAAHG